PKRSLAGKFLRKSSCGLPSTRKIVQKRTPKLELHPASTLESRIQDSIFHSRSTAQVSGLADMGSFLN
ncbi:MAG: hypothetical protein P8X79_11135, partial [Reinekea sp.]